MMARLTRRLASMRPFGRRREGDSLGDHLAALTWPWRHPVVRHWGTLRRGWSCCDVQSIDAYACQRLEPMLRYMAAHMDAHHPDMSMDEWRATIIAIADGFAAHQSLQQYPDDTERERLGKVRKRGLKLFVKYFDHLWM